MAKVIQAFKERYHDFKLYNIGEDYPEDDKKRVKYLAKQGFLEAKEEKAAEKRKKDVNSDGDSDA